MTELRTPTPFSSAHLARYQERIDLNVHCEEKARDRVALQDSGLVKDRGSETTRARVVVPVSMIFLSILRFCVDIRLFQASFDDELMVDHTVCTCEVSKEEGVD